MTRFRLGIVLIALAILAELILYSNWRSVQARGTITESLATNARIPTGFCGYVTVYSWGAVVTVLPQ